MEIEKHLSNRKMHGLPWEDRMILFSTGTLLTGTDAGAKAGGIGLVMFTE